VTDLHRHFVDQLTIPSRQGKGVLRRVEDVFDCWFESGALQALPTRCRGWQAQRLPTPTGQPSR
jgi:isoleucyl-tRNA synthetase